MKLSCLLTVRNSSWRTGALFVNGTLFTIVAQEDAIFSFPFTALNGSTNKEKKILKKVKVYFKNENLDAVEN